ncbi:flavin-containing monooxygenase [Sphingomonas sp. KC8]|uniref:flavin-containing monooxygenase n=1 Tax=Sphingomonas sp. KC8 TaxID=1030157 RepID=UPI000248A3A6|nr:NAD(P)/FAD-dependent oxidoreductase [Sphingomonas sp. KC8]ARS28861.1 monooxygenase [Sphingomonas sp. KC8]
MLSEQETVAFISKLWGEATMARILKAVVIGAGMAGILAAIRLRELGHNVTVLEKADRVGGTWRENRYAGLHCDVPAHAYTYSFAPNPDWSRYLSPGPEIQRYFEKVADDYGVTAITRFGEEVAEARWDGSLWRIETKKGLKLDADILIAATGVLHHPRMPDIAGLDSFAGPAFHSARWQDGIDLSGKRVGIIGNGSTGVQIVSALAGVAAKTVHFQRSPQWIMPVPNDFYTDEQRAAFRADPKLVDAIRYNPEYEANVRNFSAAINDMNSEQIHQIEWVVNNHLETAIADPVLRERLRPTYRAACKRLIYSWDYYEKVQRPDVEVVVEGIERIEPQGVRDKEGRLHELDVLILATGFHADRFVRPINMIGRGDVALNDVWAKRPSAYLAVSIPDFPNMFLLNGPTGPVGNFSLIDIAEKQMAYIEQLIGRIAAGEANTVSASHAAMSDYDDRRITAAKGTIFASGCSSWYLDAEGVPASWPWSYDAFSDAMSTPKLEDFDIAA